MGLGLGRWSACRSHFAAVCLCNGSVWTRKLDLASKGDGDRVRLVKVLGLVIGK